MIKALSKVLVLLVCLFALDTVFALPSSAATGYAVQQFSPQTQGGSFVASSITDFYGNGAVGAILEDMWVHPGGSNCNTLDQLNNCEWIEHGKIYGIVGNYNGSSSPPSDIQNYKGHFYAYNRCTDKCRFYQINYSNNIPPGKNEYHISWNNNTWYLLLDGNYVQDLPQFGQLNYSKYTVVGIERQDGGWRFVSPVQLTNWRYKSTSGTWASVLGLVTDADNGVYNMDSQFNGNTQTITIYQN